MEQNVRFVLVGYTEKKTWADYEQLLRAVFSSLHGQKEKKIKNIEASALKKLHKMKLIKIFFFP